MVRFSIYSKSLSLMKIHISVFLIKCMLLSQEWWWIPPILLLRKKLRHKYAKFEARVGYITELKENLDYVIGAYLKDARVISSSGASHLLTHVKVWKLPTQSKNCISNFKILLISWLVKYTIPCCNAHQQQ